eukprot:10915460-Prorocentrum_lima.AAC.1
MTDHFLTRTWWGKVSDPALRNPQHMVDVMMFVRYMIGEVRVRAQEEEMELKTFPALTNNVMS